MDDTVFCAKHSPLCEIPASLTSMHTHIWIFLHSLHYILLDGGGAVIQAHFVYLTKRTSLPKPLMNFYKYNQIFPAISMQCSVEIQNPRKHYRNVSKRAFEI